ncbi:hypothetical protein ACIBO5_53535 [Nonomuraea angiospora]|uniref:hypothetical protein n=1 Tax=Nonomuraea angiospora TaxID=46172 RepID=UPI00379D00C6
MTSVEWPATPGGRPRPRIRQEPTGIAFVDALFCDPPRHRPSHERGWNAGHCQALLLRAAATKTLPAAECGQQLRQGATGRSGRS